MGGGGFDIEGKTLPLLPPRVRTAYQGQHRGFDGPECFTSNVRLYNCIEPH